MRIQQWFILLGTVACNVSDGWGDVIFSQDFAAGNPYSQYVSTSPNDHQFNTINWSSASGSIVNGALQFTRNSSGSAWFARTTSFTPSPSALIYSFDLDVSNNSQYQASTAVWQVGSGFAGTSADQEQLDHIHSRFGIGFDSSSGSYRFLDMNGNSSSASGSKAITWVINNSGANLSYLGPDNAIHTVGDDAYDLWADTSQVFDEVKTQHGDRPLNNFKFSFLSGNYGTIRQDNIIVRSVQPVPEPAATGLIAVAFLAVVVGGGIARDRIRKAHGVGGNER